MRLRRTNVSSPGFTRRRRGKGFDYLDEAGVPIDDEEALERIRALVIPPAWNDVWICPYPNGHIQATGIDARGRKQYRYHEGWRQRRDQEKFDSMVDFARALPRMREHVAEDLQTKGLNRNRVLAAATRLLDRGFFRVGGEDYAVENETYGLATMRKEHVRVEDGGVIAFDYPAKSGKRHLSAVVDPQICQIVLKLKRRRGGGPELLAYQHGRRWTDIKSDDVNEYVKQAMDGDYSAKDFRTWKATVLAARALAVSPAALDSERARKRAEVRAVKEVAYYLGNTPAVARASYIDPRVFDRFASGLTIAGALEHLADDEDVTIESAVIDLICGAESDDIEHLSAAA
jgi:DNA topoisomerase IB